MCMSEYTSDTCPSCNTEFKRLGSHWAQSSCDYVTISSEQIDIATGLLMGDGCLCNRDGNPYLVVQCIEKEYLYFLDEKFSTISSGPPRLHITGEELKEKYGEWLGADKDSNYNDQYRWQTRGIPSLSRFSDWYESGKKQYPKELILTPTILKHWYAGDGNYNNNGTNNYISIGVSNESDNKKKIDRIFQQSGLPSPNRWSEYGKKSEIVWNTEESKEIMRFMNNPVDGYEYKWMEVNDE